jgi:ribosomal-protein-alanine N-acetyltransferase
MRDTLGRVVRRAAETIAESVVNITSIIRGAFQNGLGYYALSPHEGQGYLRAGLSAVLERASGEHELQRLEANIQPENTGSARLVRSLGFPLEGRWPARAAQ